MNASELRLYFLLQIAAHQIKKAADGRLGTVAALSTAQAAVLAIVEARAPVSQRSLARELRQNESAMTAMVNRLLALGYVARERSDSDARAWELRPTEAGRSALKAIRPPFRQINQTLEQLMTPAEMLALAGTLKRIIEAFDSGDAGG
jgi:DNA-binding MarR family transcriptional regulator